MTHHYAACISLLLMALIFRLTFSKDIQNADYNVAKGLGRAEIRRDGFVSLTTEYNLPMPQASLLVPITLSFSSLLPSSLIVTSSVMFLFNYY